VTLFPSITSESTTNITSHKNQIFSYLLKGEAKQHTTTRAR